MALAKPLGFSRQWRGPDKSIARHCVGDQDVGGRGWG